MGVYLSSPITDKISVDSVCKDFRYGASSMQGWRMTQEDAHNCLPDFDEDEGKAFFAVYDGHGGAEVAQYCALNFPGFLKDHDSYKTSDMKKALEDAFLDFDSTLTDENVIRELRILAGDDDKNAEEEEDGVPVGKSETDLLRQEADMPLDELLSKYKQPSPGAFREIRKQQQDQMLSPALKPKAQIFSGDCTEEADSSIRTGRLLDSDEGDSNNSSENRNANNSNVSQYPVSSNVEDKLINGHADNENNLNKEKEIQDSLNQQKMGDDAVSSSSSFDQDSKISKDPQTDSSDKNVSQSTDKSISQSSACQSSDNSSQNDSEACPVTAGRSAEASSSGVTSCSSSDSIAACSSSSGAGASSSVDEAGPSESAGGSGESGSIDDEPGPSGSGSASRSQGGEIEADSDDDEEDEEYEEESEDEDDDEEEEEEEEEEEKVEDEDDGFVNNPAMDMTNEEPGSDSGCTACVALLLKNQLFVANAGDSRCVLSRGGRAVDLSMDHKPEDAPERMRIEKAGGKVTSDGRVNRGLNLSRALGDHFYKRNTDVSAREQMITALPDIMVTSLQDDDEFIVLACDGIWNFMSSQEVVDMVRQKTQDPLKREKLSIVCEEMFDYCLAPNTFGDGTGCDNMTCIIVMFNRGDKASSPGNNKRCANDMESNSSCEEVKEEKKPRVEPESTQNDV